MATKELNSGIYYTILKDTISQDIKIKSNLTEEFEINFNSITIKYYDKEYWYENFHEFMNDLMKVSNNYNRL